VHNSPDSPLGRPPAQLAGTWEIGLLGMISILFAVGAAINPAFFGSGDALHALLRDSSRVAVMAVGMTFVIANKDLDLSVGSTLGVTAVVFSLAFDPNRLGLGIGPAIALTVAARRSESSTACWSPCSAYPRSSRR
jgi:ribose transport system permease protein